VGPGPGQVGTLIDPDAEERRGQRIGNWIVGIAYGGDGLLVDVGLAVLVWMLWGRGSLELIADRYQLVAQRVRDLVLLGRRWVVWPTKIPIEGACTRWILPPTVMGRLSDACRVMIENASYNAPKNGKSLRLAQREALGLRAANY
jgi:hypothetical protein